MRTKIFGLFISIMMVVGVCGCRADPVKLFQDAEAQRKLGKLDEAIPKYQKVIELQPGNTAAHLGLALAYLKKGDKPGAVKKLNDVISLGEPKEEVSVAQETLGDLADADGDPATALSHYKRAADVDIDKIIAVRIKIIKDFISKGDQKSAAAELLEIMSANGDNPDVKALLGDPVTEGARSELRSQFVDAAEKELLAGNYDKAVEYLDESEAFPAKDEASDLKAKVVRAAAYSEIAKCDAASELYDEVLKIDKGYKEEAEYYDTVCLMRANNLTDSLRRFENFSEGSAFYKRAQARIKEILKTVPTHRFKVPLEKVHVRAGPGLKFKIIDKWPLAREVRVIEKEPGTSWYKINYKKERSAFMHQSVISDRPIAINIKKNGWEQTTGKGWMLSFVPSVEVKITNLGTDPIEKLYVEMIIKQGKKVFSKDKFEIEVDKKDRLKPDESITEKLVGSAKQELLTQPDAAYVLIYAAIGDGDTELYREFYLTREVIDEEG